jgi:tetratricopeptide (TPR) repeat protein
LLPLFFEVSWNRAQDRKLLGGGFLLILIYLFISGFYQEISLFFGLMAAFTLMIRSDKRGLHVAGLVLLIVLGLIPLWTLVMEGVGSYQMYYLQLVPILLLFFARVSPRWYRAAMSLLMLGGVMAILIPSLDSLAFRGRGMRTESREVIPNQVENDSTNGLPDPEGTKEIVTGKGDSVSINPPSRRVMDFSENPLVREKAWGSKIGTGFYILGNYFRLLIFPHPLRYYYGYDQIPVVGPANPLVILSMLLYAGLIFIAFYFLRRDPPLSFGLLAYLASIAFYSNMYLPVAGMLGERLAYTASLGFCIAMAAGLIRLFRVPENTVLANWKKMNPVFLGVVALLLFAGAARTVVRNTYWKDSLTLYQHDLPRLSRSAKAHNLLAMSLVLEAKDLPDGVQKEKLLAQSASLFTKCSQIYDAFPFVWFDLGRVNLMLGRKEEALEAFRRSTQVDFHYASAWFYTGYLLDQKGVLDEAARNYQEAIKVDPQFLDPYTMLSYVYFKQGKMEESIQVNLSALKAMPSAYDPMVNLGKTYTHIGDKGNAAIWLEKAYQIKGSDRELLSILSKLFEGMGDESKAGFYKERLRSLDN